MNPSISWLFYRPGTDWMSRMSGTKTGQIIQTVTAMGLALVAGASGSALAYGIGTPMPLLMGAFVATAAVSLAKVRVWRITPAMPMSVRNLFVAVIGVMIGSGFHPGFFGQFSQIWLLAIGVLMFVPAALALNITLFRRFGGYDTQTAFFSAMPGGLIESVTMGEKAGADTRTLSLQQFSRIALVITLLPSLLSLWNGQKVGSAAGVTLTDPRIALDLWDWAILLLSMILGSVGGRALKIPAGILVGPMILSAGAHLSGVIEAGPPFWLVSAAQVIVGTGLGSRFAGFSVRQIRNSIMLAMASVLGMLVIDGAVVFIISRFSDIPAQILFISFAPGGITETALIALSLNANPVLVTTMHIFRILITVSVGAGFARYWMKNGNR